MKREGKPPPAFRIYMPNSDQAVLVLADGTTFRGRSIGATGAAVGEVVFNTAMTGYQEILTDPSYCRQIVTLTYPHIGNTGVNDEDQESARVYAEGLVIRDPPRLHSNWRAKGDLSSYLKKNRIVGIADLDTRKLTRILREKGAQNGCLAAGDVNVEEALKKARAFPGLGGMDLAKVVSTKKAYEWNEGGWELGKGYRKVENPRFHVGTSPRLQCCLSRTLVRTLSRSTWLTASWRTSRWRCRSFVGCL